MRLYLLSLLLTLKRAARDKALVLVAALLPVGLLLLGGLLTGDQPVATLRAGVLFDPDDPVAAGVYAALPQHPSLVFLPYTPQEREALEQAIRTGDLECGYLLEEPLTRGVESGRLDGAVTLLKSPRSVADPILSDLLFAAVLEAASPAIATGLIQDVIEADDTLLRERVVEGIAWHGAQGEDHFVRQEAGYLDGTPLEEGSASAARVLHGVLALFLLALLLFSLPGIVGDKSAGLWSRLGSAGLLRYYGGVWTALTLQGLAVGALGLLAMGLGFPGLLSSPAVEAGMLLAFAACIAMLGVLCVLLLRSPDLFYAASILLLLLVTVLGGVLFDLREISLALSAVSRAFPTDWYLTGVLRGGGAAPLLGVTALAGGLSAARLLLYGRTHR